MIDHKIPADFLKQEIRNGFTVSEVMKRSWAAYLEILDDIRGICDKHSLKLFACYGTLLGAVREHGIIAWDDDVDVGLVGMDYVQFLDVLSREYGDRYSVLNPYTKTWYSMNFTHISNTLKVSFGRDHLRRWHGCPFMTGLDVYPYYYIPRNTNDEKFILDLLAKIDTVIGMNRQLVAQNDKEDTSSQSGLLGQAVAVKLVELQRETGYEFNTERPIENQLEILYDQVCRLTPEEDADYVARYDEYAKDRTRKIPKDYFETTVSMPFEYTTVPVPVGYDAILQGRFGNGYIMPKRERGAHDYPYYGKQIDDRKYYEAQINDPGRKRYSAETERTDRNKRTVLYHTGMREMLIHCDRVIDKIRNVIGYTKDKEETVELWWMPDVFLKSDEMALDEVAPELMKHYEAVIDDYIRQSGNVCDIETDIDRLIENCDEYYGDPGVIADRFKEAGKMVTIQDYSADSIEIDRNYTGCIIRDESLCVKDLQTDKTITDAKDENTDKDRNINAERESKIIPDAWKSVIYREDGSRKKIILYVTSVSVLYQYKEKMLDKIRDTKKIFRDHTDDIAILWKFDPILSDIEDIFDTDFVDQINDFLDEYRRECWGILVGDDTEDAVMLADAVYGDADEMVARCLKRGIPVMLENPECCSA